MVLGMVRLVRGGVLLKISNEMFRDQSRSVLLLSIGVLRDLMIQRGVFWMSGEYRIRSGVLGGYLTSNTRHDLMGSDRLLVR